MKTRAMPFRLLSVTFMVSLFVTSNPAHAGEMWKEALVQPPELQAPQRGSLAGSLAEGRMTAGDVGRGSFELPFPMPLTASCAALPVNVWPAYTPERGLSPWGQGWSQRLEILRHRAVGSVAFDDSDEFQSPWGILVPGDDGLYYTKGFSGGIVARMDRGGWRAWSPSGDVYTFGQEAALQSPRGTGAWFLTHVSSADGTSADLVYARSSTSAPALSSVVWGLGPTRCARLAFHYVPLDKKVRRYSAGIRADIDRRVDRVELFVSRGDGPEKRAKSLELQHDLSILAPSFYLASVATRFPSGALGPPTSYSYVRWEDFVASIQVEDNLALIDFSTDRSRYHRGSLSSQHVTLFDVDDDGHLDIESSDDFTTFFFRDGRYVPSPQKWAATAHPRCQSRRSAHNAPRPLARMFGHGTAPEVVRLLMHDYGSTELRVCSRDGSLIADKILPGCWVSGANTRLVDLDRDGRADLVRVGPKQVLTSQNLSQDGDIKYGPRREQAIYPSIDADVSWFYDLNGDGVVDLISLSEDGIWVWYGLGDLAFDPTGQHYPIRIGESTYTRALSDDFFSLDANHDGMIDLLVLRQGRYPSLFINTGRSFEHFPLPQLEVFAHGAHGLTVADLSGSGASELTFTLDQRPSRLRLDSPETSLLSGVSDGFGNSWHLTYARGKGRPGSGPQPPLVEKIVARTSGQPDTTQFFAYHGPRRDRRSQSLLGFEQVSAEAQGQREELTYDFFEDHAPQVSRQSLADLHRRSPARHSRTSYVPAFFRGQPFARVESQEEGWQDQHGELVGKRSRRFVSWSHPGCVSQEVTKTPWGDLVSEQTLADLQAWGPALHCSFSRRTLTGRHTDPGLDFSYAVSRAYDPRGKVMEVGLDGGDIVQALTYDDLGRMTAANSSGIGRIELTYDGPTRHIKSALSPDGVKMEVDARVEETGEPTAITRYRGDRGWTQRYTFDDEQRLSTTSDDFRGSVNGDPLVRHVYRRPSEISPGVTETTSLWDAGRRTSDAIISDGAGRTLGTSLFLDGQWILRSLVHYDAGGRMEKTHRLTRPILDAPPQLHTYAQLRASAVPQPTSWLHYDGMGALREAGRQLSDDGVIERLTWRQEADARGGVTTEAFAGHPGQVTRRDSGGLVTSITDEEGHRTDATYDAAGRLRGLTFADGTTHSVAYDDLGRQRSSCREGIGCVQYVYNGSSSLVSKMIYLDRKGRRVRSLSQEHDQAGRIVAKVFRDLGGGNGDKDKTYEFLYDGVRPDCETLPGQVGHLTGVRGPDFSKAWSYYPDGSLHAFELSINGWRQFRETLTYWADGKIKASERCLIDLTDGRQVLQQSTFHGRDDNGRDNEIKVNGETALLYFYDSEGRASGVGLPDGSSLLLSREKASDLWSTSDLQTPSVSSTLSSAWDDRGNVAKQTLTNGPEYLERRISYDSRGFLIASSGTTDHIQYDLVGRQQRHVKESPETFARDSEQRLIQWDRKHFMYGADGLLSQITLPNAGTCRYAADEQQKRLWHSEEDGKRWAYASSSLFSEQEIRDSVDLDGRTVAVVENGSVRLVMTDALSTPLMEGSDGFRWAPPFGSSHSSSSLALSGQTPSCSGTLVTMGTRDYFPVLGEFLTPDLLFFHDPSLSLSHPKESNLFSFGKNNPLKHVDRGGDLVGAAFLGAEGVAVAQTAYWAVTGAILSGNFLAQLSKEERLQHDVKVLEILRDSGTPAGRLYASGRLAGMRGGIVDLGDFADAEWKINGPGGEYDNLTKKVSLDYPTSRYGHAFTKHGQNRSRNLIMSMMRCKDVSHQEGQWRDDAAAKKFLDEIAPLMEGKKELTVPLPGWVSAVVYTREGVFPATHARLVSGNRLFKTAYPTR